MKYVTPALFFGWLCYALYEVQGHYGPTYIVTLSILFFLLIRNQVQELRPSLAFDRKVAAITFVVFCVCLCIFRNGVVHATVSTPLKVHLKLTAVLGLCFLFFRHPALGWLTLLGLFTAKVWVLIGSPHPFIDTFTTTTEAVRYFLGGENPYAQAYTDIYAGKFGYRPTFGYWPGVLLSMTPAYFLFKDIRSVFIIADLLTLVLLYRLIKKERLFLCVLWFSIPTSFYVLEQSWNESLLILWVTLFTLSLWRERWWAAGLAAGLFCATKQYGVFLGLMGLVYALRFSWRAAREYLLSSAMIFGALMLPFLLWNPHAFIDSSVTVLLEMKLRLDQMSLPALMANAFGFYTPGWVLTLVNVAATILAVAWVWRARREVLTVVQALFFVYGMSFLFGKQASCNYYSFLAFLALLLGVLQHGLHAPKGLRK